MHGIPAATIDDKSGHVAEKGRKSHVGLLMLWNRGASGWLTRGKRAAKLLSVLARPDGEAAGPGASLVTSAAHGSERRPIALAEQVLARS